MIINELLHYTTRAGYAPAMAVSLLHDTPVRPGNPDEMEIMSKIWKQRDDFHCDQAKFIPYYSKDNPVKVRQDGIYASAYRRADNHLLLVISNLTDKTQDATLDFQPPWSKSNGMEITLPSQGFKIIELSPDI